MTLSIVTAVLNRHQFVAASIQSLQNQTYTQFEHLVQDGGSTDGTLEIVRSLADTRCHIVSEPDAGIYDAINKGISRSTGDIVGLLHSDDIFGSKDVLSMVCDTFATSEVDGVYGDLEYVSATNPDHVIRHWRAGEYDRRMLRNGWMPPHPTLFLRRHVFDRWGAYDTNYKIAADYDAILRWLGKGQIALAYIPEVLVRMRVGGASNKSIPHILRKSREDYLALRANRIGGLKTLTLKNVSKVHQFMISAKR